MRRLFFLVLLASAQIAVAQTEFNAGDFGAFRVENEIKLAIPDGKSDEVWSYLQGRYLVPDVYIKQYDSTFTCISAEDLFRDSYYDDNSYTLLSKQSGVRHRRRVVLTDSTNRKNGRELVQIKLNDIDSNALNRGELKFPVQEMERDQKKWDDHVFLGVIDREYREEVLKLLKEHGVDGEELSPAIEIEQLRRRIYILKGGAPFATLTLDDVTAHAAGQDKKVKFTEMEMELNEIAYTESDTAVRANMEKVNELLKSDLLGKFPDIKQDQTPKYNKAAIRLGLEPGKNVRGGGGSSMMLILGAVGALVLVVIVVMVLRKRKSAGVRA